MCYIRQKGPGSNRTGIAHTQYTGPPVALQFPIVRFHERKLVHDDCRGWFCSRCSIKIQQRFNMEWRSYHRLKQSTQGVVTIDLCLNSSRLVIFSCGLETISSGPLHARHAPTLVHIVCGPSIWQMRLSVDGKLDMRRRWCHHLNYHGQADDCDGFIERSPGDTYTMCVGPQSEFLIFF